MYVACVVGGSAYVTVLVSVGCVDPPEVAPLAGPQAATRAASPAAAQHAASTRRARPAAPRPGTPLSLRASRAARPARLRKPPSFSRRGAVVTVCSRSLIGT